MIPTNRSYFLFLIVGVVAAILYGISAEQFRWGNSLACLLIGNLGLFVLMISDVRRVKQSKVNVKRQTLHRLSIGQLNPVQISIETGKSLAFNQIEIRDAYPSQFPVSVDTLSIVLPPKTAYEISYTIKPLKRGIYHWGDLQVRQRGPFGLADHDWLVSAKQEVSVYPDLLSLRSLTIKLAMQSAGAIRQRRRMGMGTEFAELRDYRDGDDPRLIDWKATARRDRPLLRVLEPEQEQTLIILLDRGRLMTAQVEGLSRFDHGLNALLALATAGLHRGDRVGVGVFDREMYCWLPPERGQNQLPKIIERLTAIQPELLEPDYMLAVSKVVQQQSRRALVVMLTDVVDSTASAELLGSLTRLTPRYLPFCVTLRDPEVDRLAHNSINPETTEGMPGVVKNAYCRAVAIDLLSQRELVFANLRRKGVLVLDAPAHQVSEPLVDRYLQLKLRNLL